MPSPSRKPKLTVVTDTYRQFVHVPSERAQAVRTYLRSHGVFALHPEPVTLGTESLEIGGKGNAGAVQLLLDQWAKS